MGPRSESMAGTRKPLYTSNCMKDPTYSKQINIKQPQNVENTATLENIFKRKKTISIKSNKYIPCRCARWPHQRPGYILFYIFCHIFLFHRMLLLFSFHSSIRCVVRAFSLPLWLVVVVVFRCFSFCNFWRDGVVYSVHTARM